MITLRRFLTAEYDWTGIGSKLLQSKAWYLGSLISVAVFTFLLIVIYHLWYVGMAAKDFSSTAFGLEHMFPIITYYTLAVVVLPFLLLLSRIFHIWRLTMASAGIGFSHYLHQAWVYVYELIAQPLMRKCPEHKRWFGHEVLAGGTVLMLSIKVFGLRWFQTDRVYSIYNPQRWPGYLAAACILYGIGDILIGRWRAKKQIYKETHFHDLIFPILIVSTAISGLAAHVLRYAGFGLAWHYVYALHVIIATPMLMIEMSFGKSSHMVYRPLALYFLAVKERPSQGTAAVEAARMSTDDGNAATVGAALVVGGGIGGMQAALDLAAGGLKVYLAERNPAIGGVMAQLDKTFPTNDCAMCTWRRGWSRSGATKTSRSSLSAKSRRLMVNQDISR